MPSAEAIVPPLTMTAPTTPSQDKARVSLRYLWPTPTGLMLWFCARAVSTRLGHQAFIATHGLFEVGLLIAFLASLVYSIGLRGSEESLAPRWVWFVNLSFAPLIFGIMASAALYSCAMIDQ